MITQEQRATLEAFTESPRREPLPLAYAVRCAIRTIDELTRERDDLRAQLAARRDAYEEPQCTCDIVCAGYLNSDRCACGCKAACHR